MDTVKKTFASALLNWYDTHGRHDLPWQKNRTLYRVWIAEIMLQQTQVKTVIPYYQKFMRRFPNLKTFAQADTEVVMQHWAGLGYYSRARNLHRAAQQVMCEHAGRMPRTSDALMALPGIGRSTAAAILSQALDQRHTILDGNVKRVLSRYAAIDGWPGRREVEQKLWQLAETLTPNSRNCDYTQAIMDLGATLCTRSRPHCETCPVSTGCSALKADEVARYPGKKPAKKMPVKQSRFLILVDAKGAVLLEKRPPSGIWGGLWSLPEVATDVDVNAACKQRWGLEIAQRQDQPVLRHTFSHYHLDIHPSACSIAARGTQIADAADIKWFNQGETLPAVAAPVSKLLSDMV